MSDERTVTTGRHPSVTDEDVERAMSLYYGTMSPVAKYMGDGPNEEEAADYRDGFRAVLEDFVAARASGDATRDDVDLPTAPCPWCLRHHTAAGWGDHYNAEHEPEGRAFVPFDVIERWYYSTDDAQMTLTDIANLYLTGRTLPQKREANDE